MTAVLSARERRRRRRRDAERRGVALVLVLGAITVLTVFLTELQEDTAAELSGALAERDALKAEYYARSGVNMARMLIATEPTINKAIAPIFALMMGGKKPPQIPVWEFADMIIGPFNGNGTSPGLAGMDMSTAKNLGLTGGGRWELVIVDEDSKININAAAAGDSFSELKLGAQILGLITPPQYDPLFDGRDLDNQFTDRFTLCGALVDWADPDENHKFNCDPKASGAATGGAKDNIYQSIGLIYRRKNAAYDSLEELRLVRGVGDDFWATFVDPDPSDPHKRQMTIWGQNNNKINVNSASPVVLLALTCNPNVVTDATELCKDPIQQTTFLMMMGVIRGMLKGAPIFLSGSDFTDTMEGKGMLGPVFTSLGIKPVTFKDKKGLQKLLDTRSKMFSIYADGIVPGYRRQTKVRIHAVVDFRSATDIGAPPITMGGGQVPTNSPGLNITTPASSASPTGGPPGSPGSAPGAGTGMSGDPLTPQQILQAMNSSPAGNVVYWRVE